MDYFLLYSWIIAFVWRLTGCRNQIRGKDTFAKTQKKDISQLLKAYDVMCEIDCFKDFLNQSIQGVSKIPFVEIK